MTLDSPSIFKSESTSTSNWVGPALLYAVPALLIAILILGTTRRWGVSVDPDGTAYLDSANSLAHGHGLVLHPAYPTLEPLTRGKTPFPLFWWAPLYPSLLALFVWAGVGLITVARWLDAALLVGTTIVIGLLVRDATRSSKTGLGAAVFVAISPAIFSVYSGALSEPLFLFLSYLGLGLLAVHLRSGRWCVLALASVSIALALLARYAGLPLVATGVFALMLFDRRGLLSRLARTAFFAVVALLPLVLWLVRNQSETGFATGRPISWHPISVSRVAHGAVDTSLFLFPELHGAPHILAFGLVAAVLVGITFFGWRRLKVGLTPPFIKVVLLYIPFYAISLALSISLFDASTNLSVRFILPLYPGVVAVVAWILSSIGAGSPARRSVLAVAVGATACLAVVSTTLLARDLETKGSGYTSKVWRNSSGIGWINALPADVLAYSNAPEAVYFLTGRYVDTVPVKIEAIKASPNPGYGAETATMVRDVRRGAVVIIFEDIQRPSLATESAISAQLGNVPVRHLRDATVYGRAAG